MIEHIVRAILLSLGWYVAAALVSAWLAALIVCGGVE